MQPPPYYAVDQACKCHTSDWVQKRTVVKPQTDLSEGSKYARQMTDGIRVKFASLHTITVAGVVVSRYLGTEDLRRRFLA